MTDGKTIREWYNELPEHIRVKAFISHRKGYYSSLGYQVSTMSEAINAINWSRSGMQDFWRELYLQYQIQERKEYGEDS